MRLLLYFPSTDVKQWPLTNLELTKYQKLKVMLLFHWIKMLKLENFQMDLPTISARM